MSAPCIILGFAMALAACTAAFLVIRDTKRGSGKWGVNVRRRDCPTCGTPLPRIRCPQNERQCLWGGSTCEECGTETDKWGKVLAAKAGDA